jgi:hypothetical protein
VRAIGKRLEISLELVYRKDLDSQTVSASKGRAGVVLSD